MALTLAGVTAAPHFDRTAFKARRTFVTLAADGLSANFRFTPDEQEFRCMLRPDAFRPIPNGWGRQGWTVGTLAMLDANSLQSALETAHTHAVVSPRRKLRFT